MMRPSARRFIKQHDVIFAVSIVLLYVCAFSEETNGIVIRFS